MRGSCHHLGVDKGRSRTDTLGGFDFFQCREIVGKGTVIAHDDDMGINSGNAGFQVGFGSRHNRNNDNQRHHADHDAHGGQDSNHRDKGLFLF